MFGKLNVPVYTETEVFQLEQVATQMKPGRPRSGTTPFPGHQHQLDLMRALFRSLPEDPEP